MSAFFVSASSQRLSNAGTLITAAPFTVGMWVRPTTTGTEKYFWSLTDTGVTNQFWSLGYSAASAWRFNCNGAKQDYGIVTANVWAFAIFRTAGVSNRWGSILVNGVVSSNQDVSTKTPTSIDRLSFGCLDSSVPSNFFDGDVAEYWMTNTDVQGDGLTTNPELMRQLAYAGPFSIPHIQKDIVEYHSFRNHLSSDAFENDDDVPPILGETLTNTNGVTLSAAPPLPYWYIRPQQTQRLLVV